MHPEDWLTVDLCVGFIQAVGRGERPWRRIGAAGGWSVSPAADANLDDSEARCSGALRVCYL